MKTVKWSDTKRRADDARRAAGLPVPAAAERAAAVDQLRDDIHAWRLAELEALGGRLRLVADFGDDLIQIA